MNTHLCFFEQDVEKDEECHDEALRRKE
jgi:hypothetical protein